LEPVCPLAERRIRCPDSAAANAALSAEIDERKRTAEQLREQAAVLDLAPVLVRAMDSRIVLWTQGAERLYGFSKAETLNRVSHDILHTQFPVSKEEVDERLRRAGNWQSELVHRKRNGERLVVSSQQMVYCDSTGRPVRILEVNADITERKETEAALRESEQRFRQVTENISEVIDVESEPGKGTTISLILPVAK
jgi:PAS domain S-box-containing protein